MTRDDKMKPTHKTNSAQNGKKGRWERTRNKEARLSGTRKKRKKSMRQSVICSFVKVAGQVSQGPRCFRGLDVFLRTFASTHSLFNCLLGMSPFFFLQRFFFLLVLLFVYKVQLSRETRTICSFSFLQSVTPDF